MMRMSSSVLILTAAFVLLALPLEAKMSDRLTKFMAKSGVGKYCQSKGMSDDQCIMYLKKLCGMQDVSNPQENDELDACTRREVCGRGLTNQDNGVRAIRQKLQWSWKKTDLSYFVYNMPPKTTLTKDEVVSFTHEALAVWACYTNLRMRKSRTMEDADIVVIFSDTSHSYYSTGKNQMISGSDGSPFDGQGGTLAHAFFPIGDHIGNLHMDNSESWSANMNPGGLNTFNVLVHELGHALGLPHSKSNEDIMAPFYNGRVKEKDLDLGSWEKSAIQSFYGSKACTDKTWQTYFSRKYSRRFVRRADAKEMNCDLYHPDNCKTSETFRTSCPQVCDNAKRADAKEIDCDLYHPDNCKTSETFRTSCPQVCENAKRADDDKCALFHPDNCKTSEWYKTNCQETCANAQKRSTSGNKAHVCKRGSLHGIFDFVDGFTYIISGGSLYRRNNAAGHIDMSFRRKLSKLWKGAPANPTAAVYSRAAKRLFLFKGKDVYVISGLKGDILSKAAKVKRVTIKDSKYPDSPSAAFVKFDDRKSGNVYLVKGTKVFVFSTSKKKVIKTFAFKKLFEVGGYKNRIPRKVDGAYHLFKADKKHNPANSLFFFTGSSYTLAIPDKKTGKYNIPSGTAAFSTAYLHCPQK